uniref:Uncharacterized protein n=1 Tax=Solanum tuberosum TaxID=4113 RepID=M1DBV0_SOLTU
MNNELASLQVNVTQLQSIDLSMLNAMGCLRADDDLAEQIDEEELRSEKDEERISLSLTAMHETKEAIVLPAMVRSLRENSVGGTNGVCSNSTIPPSVVTGIDAPVDTTLQPLVILLSGIDAPDDVSHPETLDESAPQA